MKPPLRRWVRLGALVGVLAGAWLLWRSPALRGMVTAEHLLEWRVRLGTAWWSPGLFVVAYTVGAALDFSGLALTLAGGVVFGFKQGLLLNTIGANLGASAAYWLARGLGKDALASMLGRRFARVEQVAATGGFLWLLRLRLIPVVPFNLLNLGAGLAGIPWRTFASATALGILPGTVIYTFFADAIVTGSTGASRAAFVRLLIAGGLLLVLSFLPALARKNRHQAPAR